MIQTEERRPGGDGAAHESSATTTTHHPSGWQRRRRAAERLAPLADGRADPWLPVEPTGPSTFDLTEAELRAEANRLYRDGWTLTEVCAVLEITPRDGGK